MIWFYALSSVLLVSLISMVGVVTLFFGEKKINKILILLVSLAAGTMLGASFFHLIPETVGDEGISSIFFVLLGFLIFFVLEKVIRWRHCHNIECDEHTHAFPYMILVGDGVHNFIDGVLIAAAFLVDSSLGFATVVAVLLHEIPQEIGDFGALIYAGFSRIKAITYNFISALLSVLGAIIVLALGDDFLVHIHYLIPITAGGFIYIAAVDLFPEMHKSNKFGQSLGQFIFVLLGIGIMWAMTLVE